MNIRNAEERDCLSLVRLISRLGYAAGVEELRTRLGLYSGSELDRVLVADIDGTVVGLIVLNAIKPFHEKSLWGRISALVVDESVRGKGIGTRLLQAADDFFMALGCSKVELTSGEQRVEAHEFYKGRGFEDVPKRFVKRFEL